MAALVFMTSLGGSADSQASAGAGSDSHSQGQQGQQGQQGHLSMAAVTVPFDSTFAVDIWDPNISDAVRFGRPAAGKDWLDKTKVFCQDQTSADFPNGIPWYDNYGDPSLILDEENERTVEEQVEKLQESLMK